MPHRDDPVATNQLFGRYRRNVIVMITLCYGLGYVCRLALNVVKKPLMDAGIFTPEEVGLIGSMMLGGYAVGKFTNGFLADHAHAGRFLAAGLFLSALCNVGMSLSTVLVLSAVLWAFNGWFQGFGAPACAVSLANWYGNNERGRVYGVWSTAHSIGEGLTYLGIAYLIAAAPKGLGLGWQWGFWVPAAVCVFAALLALRYLPDRPATLGLPSVAQWKGDHSAMSAHAVSADSSVWRTQLKILAIPSIWVLALASSSMYVTRYAINSWGNVYLQEIRGFDDFLDRRLPADSAAARGQRQVVGKLREIYGTHVCDAGKIISVVQKYDNGEFIDDCLGHQDGTVVDNVEDVDLVVGWLAEYTRPHGFAISETQFHVFILNASRRLFSDRFFTSSFRPEFYSHLGYNWVVDNGPLDDCPYPLTEMKDVSLVCNEPVESNGHTIMVSPLKRLMMRNIPQLRDELMHVVNVFDPWARDRGEYYSLDWKPRPDARADPAFVEQDYEAVDYETVD